MTSDGMLPAPFTLEQVDAYIANGGVTIVNSTFIKCDQVTVFDFVTRPTQWHRWHPATKEVTNAPDRPLVTGDTMCEHIQVVGQHFDAVWKVFSCAPHTHWVIATVADHGDSKITYDCKAVEGGCQFTRQLQYRSKNWFMRLLDGNLIKWAINRQSATALANLTKLLESGKA